MFEKSVRFQALNKHLHIYPMVCWLCWILSQRKGQKQVRIQSMGTYCVKDYFFRVSSYALVPVLTTKYMFYNLPKSSALWHHKVFILHMSYSWFNGSLSAQSLMVFLKNGTHFTISARACKPLSTAVRQESFGHRTLLSPNSFKGSSVILLSIFERFTPHTGYMVESKSIAWGGTIIPKN